MIHPFSFKGQGLPEYALIIVMVALIIIVALALFGNGVLGMYTNIIANI
ncbi:MAG TPA: pilus assembly protein [Anaerolineaceae bacterium]|jgi:Flp pilus assembly pilin Flp